MKYPFLDLKTVNEPYMERLCSRAREVVLSGRYVGGAEVEDFEKKLARSTGTDYAIGCANGLDAIRLIFRALLELNRLQPGDEVIVPANTYIASILAVTDCGLTPVFVEPDERTMNLSGESIRPYITDRTKAVLTVHLYGRCAYDAEFEKIVKDNNLILVEDNAQAIGAEAFNSKRTGNLGVAAAFSFYPTKNIGALGDAGAVTTSDKKLADAVRAIANYGSDRRYHNIYKGLNSRLDPIQAAFLSLKLDDLENESRRRRRLATVYDTEITNPLVRKPELAEGHVWHQYVVRVRNREAFRNFLEQNGVQTDIHYATPPHLQPCYAEYAHLQLPETEKLAREVVSLPISACTSADDAREIAAIINRFQDGK